MSRRGQRILDARGYVLHASPWRETSLIVQAFTRDHGCVALVAKGQGMRVIVFAGEKARKHVKAGAIAKQVSAKLGGSGGGDDRFGQGGGRLKEKIKEALLAAEEMAKA